MKDELLNALKLIKEACNELGSDCEGCPMWSYSNGECGVTGNSPFEWNLEKREVYF